jgi:hypothetical protein
MACQAIRNNVRIIHCRVGQYPHLGCCSRLGRTLMGPTQGTKQREREQEEEQEEEHEQEHLVIHLESSWLEMRSRDRFLLRRKNKEPRAGSQAGRRDVRIIHHREGLYRQEDLRTRETTEECACKQPTGWKTVSMLRQHHPLFTLWP